MAKGPRPIKFAPPGRRPTRAEAWRGVAEKAITLPEPPPTVFTLEVSLIDGPISAEFAKKCKKVVRLIEIAGDQTLDDLHGQIFGAFDRFDPHLYEFQMGKRPMVGPRYVIAYQGYGDKPAGFTGETRLDGMRLKVKQEFWYWFDFGDDWMHRIRVEKIVEEKSAAKRPRVVKRVGESPPQYMRLEDEE